eukprot:scaffold803_cov310-Pinguiococcus_pyrenoidosus.AAC.46
MIRDVIAGSLTRSSSGPRLSELTTFASAIGVSGDPSFRQLDMAGTSVQSRARTAAQAGFPLRTPMVLAEKAVSKPTQKGRSHEAAGFGVNSTFENELYAVNLIVSLHLPYEKGNARGTLIIIALCHHLCRRESASSPPQLPKRHPAHCNQQSDYQVLPGPESPWHQLPIRVL